MKLKGEMDMMVNENTKTLKDLYEEFNSENEDNVELQGVLKKMEEALSVVSEDSLRQVLIYTKRLDEEKHLEESDFIFNWMNLYLDKHSYNLKTLNWWDKFYIRKYKGELNSVFKAIEEADVKETEKSLKEAMKSIEELDKDKYKYDIITFERRARILEKRLERTVSNNFGTILRSLRNKRRLSLAQAANLAGISASYINRMELGERTAPSYPIIEKLAEALDVDVTTLLLAAGASEGAKETKSMRGLIFSNDVYLTKDKKSLSTEKKQRLVEIIDYIAEMDWTTEKHVEALELMKLVTNFKEEE